jgi:hypothetical protein
MRIWWTLLSLEMAGIDPKNTGLAAGLTSVSPWSCTKLTIWWEFLYKNDKRF